MKRLILFLLWCVVSAIPSFGMNSGSVEILSDTQGIDFVSYTQRVLHDVRQNWYIAVPPSAQMKHCDLMIEFSILKNGKVTFMKLVQSSGDVPLDRAAWVGIADSSPFPPLPADFKGSFLALRFHFYYNPGKGEVPSTSGIAVTISGPPDLDIPAGGTALVVASVTGTKESALKWILQGLGCSGDACGKMYGDVYAAPSVLPSPPVVNLTAISKADPTARASVTIHITPSRSSQ